MRGHTLLVAARFGVALAALAVAANPAHAVGLRALRCAREAAAEASAVASAVCRSQAGSRSASNAEIYIVTLTPQESRGGSGEAIRLAEREVQRQGLCRAGVEVVLAPMPVDNSGQTELAVRCSAGRSR